MFQLLLSHRIFEVYPLEKTAFPGYEINSGLLWRLTNIQPQPLHCDV